MKKAYLMTSVVCLAHIRSRGSSASLRSRLRCATFASQVIIWGIRQGFLVLLNINIEMIPNLLQVNSPGIPRHWKGADSLPLIVVFVGE